MYEVRVQARFEAAHHLTSYRGRPEPVHGHSWQVEATVAAAELDGEGMAIDFLAVKSGLDELTARFHRRDINTVPPFDRRTPTSENLAAWFCEQLQQQLGIARVTAVTVWEAPGCSVTYRQE